MGTFNSHNPAGDGGHADRVADINAKYADGAISKEQFDELMGYEGVTSNFIQLKRAGLAVLLVTVGLFIVWANL